MVTQSEVSPISFKSHVLHPSLSSSLVPSPSNFHFSAAILEEAVWIMFFTLSEIVMRKIHCPDENKANFADPWESSNFWTKP